MIHGHSENYFHPQNNLIQVTTPVNFCTGCFNWDRKELFDKGDWNYCPENKDFECSFSIKSDLVIKELSKLLNIDYLPIKPTVNINQLSNNTKSIDLNIKISIEILENGNIIYEKGFN